MNKPAPVFFARILKWTREDNGGCEAWTATLPGTEGSGMSHFCVKNYGRPALSEDKAFSGWRLVSGGPFTQAGRWFSRQEAMDGAEPFILAYWREQAIEKRDEVLAVLAGLQPLLEQKE